MVVSLDSRAPATGILLRGSDCALVVRLRTHMAFCTAICLHANSRGRNDCPAAICTVYVESSAPFLVASGIKCPPGFHELMYESDPYG